MAFDLWGDSYIDDWSELDADDWGDGDDPLYCEKSIRIAGASSGQYVAFRDAFESDDESNSRVIQRLDYSTGKFRTPIGPAARAPSTLLTAADTFDLTALPADLLCWLIEVNDGSILQVAVEQSVSGGTLTVTPILFDDAYPPNVVGVLTPQLAAQPYAFRRGSSAGNYGLPVLSWDVSGAHKIGLQISAISGTSNGARVYGWIEGNAITRQDEWFRNVSLLMPFDGADGSIAFTDHSPVNSVITVGGGAHIETDQSKWGGSSVYFDGSGDYLTVPSHLGLDLSSMDFTIEGWFYVPSVGATMTFLDKDGVTGSYYPQYQVGMNAAGKLVAYLATGAVSAGTAYTGTTDITEDAWHHFAVVKYGTLCIGFLDGNQEWSATANAMANQGRVLNMGRETGANYFTGYMDDLRITKGKARYTAAFSVPTAAFPTTELTGQDQHFFKTSLLLHGNGSNNSQVILDSSPSPKVPTVGGDAKLSSTQKKFGDTSMYFDGTGDYLSFAHNADFNLSSGDWTIECWVYVSSHASTMVICNKDGISGSTYCQYDIGIKVTTGYLSCYLATASGSAGTAYTGDHEITVDAWHHIAVVNYNETCIGFVDGHQQWSAAKHAMADGSRALTIGKENSSANPFTGYIEDLRITKGFARYTADFSVPTARFPSNRE